MLLKSWSIYDHVDEQIYLSEAEDQVPNPGCIGGTVDFPVLLERFRSSATENRDQSSPHVASVPMLDPMYYLTVASGV